MFQRLFVGSRKVWLVSLLRLPSMNLSFFFCLPCKDQASLCCFSFIRQTQQFSVFIFQTCFVLLLCGVTHNLPSLFCLNFFRSIFKKSVLYCILPQNQEFMVLSDTFQVFVEPGTCPSILSRLTSVSYIGPVLHSCIDTVKVRIWPPSSTKESWKT